MTSRLPELVRSLRRPSRALAALALVGLIGVSAYVVTRVLRGDPHVRAADEALARNDLVQARAHLLLALEGRPDAPELHLQLARVARRAGAYDESLHHLRECERLGGIKEAIELERLLHRAQRGAFSVGERLLWAYVEKDHPDTLHILEAMARGYLDTLRLPQALTCLDRWLARQPDSQPALVLRGKLFELRLDRPEAIASYKKVLELDPDHDQTRLRLAELLAKEVRPQEALEQFQELRRRQPNNVLVRVGLAQVQITLNQLDDARRELDLVLSRDPRDVDALVQRGRVEMQALRPDLADPWLRKAVELSPYDFPAVFNFTQCLSRLGKKDELRRWQERLKEIDDDQVRMAKLVRRIMQAPQDASARCEVGKIFLKIGFDQDGLRWLFSALQEDPRHRTTNEVLARYYRRKGQPELAARYEQALGAPTKEK
jgi:tetratricopeptide (TPR) repeat protein